MKKFFTALATVLGVVIAIPIFLIICIGYLLYIPFDIIQYHKMPDTSKYSRSQVLHIF